MLLMISLPVAAAEGPSAGVETFSTDRNCESASQWDDWSGSFGNESYSYSYSVVRQTDSTDCAGRADTARVHAEDDAGPIADVRVYQENESSRTATREWFSSQSHSPSWDSYGSGDRSDEAFRYAEERGVRADVLGVSAGQSSGCSNDGSQSSSSDWNWFSYTRHDGSMESQSSSYARSNFAYDNRCTDAVDGTIAGHGASTGRDDRCAGSSAHEYGSSWYSSWGSFDSSSHASQDQCRNGLFASAEGQDVFAGHETDCASRQDAQTYSGYYSDGSPYSYTNSFESSRCFNGYVVDGPYGFQARAGNETRSSESCFNGDCSTYGSDQQAVGWTWAQSPVTFLANGGGPTPVYVPLP